jgi:hypothetical protein
MSENFGGREVSKYWKGGSLGWIVSPTIFAFLQLGVDCVSYYSFDYRTEVLSTALKLFFVLFKYILVFL